MTRQNTLSLRKQPFVFPRSSLQKSYNISKEPLQIETKFLRSFSQALVLRRTMAWTPWMLFGTPRSFEKPWRMMRSLETNGGISTNPPPLQLDSINKNLKEWKIGMKLKSSTVWCDFWLLFAVQKAAVAGSWYRGMQWVLKATFFSDSAVDRTIGFAGPDGGLGVFLFVVRKDVFLVLTGLRRASRNNFEQTIRDGDV